MRSTYQQSHTCNPTSPLGCPSQHLLDAEMETQDHSGLETCAEAQYSAEWNNPPKMLTPGKPGPLGTGAGWARWRENDCQPGLLPAMGTCWVHDSLPGDLQLSAQGLSGFLVFRMGIWVCCDSCDFLTPASLFLSLTWELHCKGKTKMLDGGTGTLRHLLHVESKESLSITLNTLCEGSADVTSLHLSPEMPFWLI